MRSFSKRSVHLLIMIFALLGCSVIFTTAGASAASSSAYGPNPGDVEQGGHRMSYFVAHADYVRVDATQIVIYSSSPSIAVAVIGADLCPSAKLFGTGDVRGEGLSSVRDGAVVSSFTLSGAASPVYGSKQPFGVCDPASNQPQEPGQGQQFGAAGTASTTKYLRSSSGSPVPTQNRGTLYRFNFDANWLGQGSGCAPGVACGVNSFILKAMALSGDTMIENGGNTWISQRGGTSANNFGVNGVGNGNGTIPSNNRNGFSTYNVPFGYAEECSTITDNSTKTIKIQDDDNYTGGPYNGSGAQNPAIDYFTMRLEKRHKNTAEGWSQESFSSITSQSGGGFAQYNYNGNWYKIGTPGSGRDITMKFTAQSGYEYRFRIRDIDPNNNLQFSVPYESVWAEVDPPCGGGHYVDIEPSTDSMNDSVQEVGNTVTFTSSTNISNFPSSGEWGYTEVAERAKVVNQNISPSRASYAATAADTENPANGNKGGCTHKDRDNNCNRWNWTCYYNKMNPAETYNKDSGTYNGNSWSNLLADRGSSPNCPPQTKWACYDYYPSNPPAVWNFAPTHNCDYKWTCPAPSNKVVKRADAPDCNIWKCQYADAVAFTDPSNDRDALTDAYCQPRCNGGRGDRAIGSKPDGTGQKECRIRPSFEINCNWSDGGYTRAYIDQNGTSNTSGQVYCQRTLPKPGNTIGKVCLSLNNSEFRGWSSPAPGYGRGGAGNYRQLETWQFRFRPGTEACAEFGVKPYMKVFGGDVRSGTLLSNDVTTSQTTCSSGAGYIRAWNKGSAQSYAGSGADYGVIARGNIEGFRSATATGLSQKGLSFANDTGEYGGELGDAPTGCDLSRELKAAKNYGSDNTVSTISSSVLVLGNGSSGINSLTAGGTFKHTGDLYIDATTIGYLPVWLGIANTPRLKMIVTGDIYIAGNVSQLDGIYVALKDQASGNGGRIITCARLSGSTPQAIPAGERYDNCRTKLTVNGSLRANDIFFLRTPNSLRDSSAGETAGAGSNNAAEVINFTPEVWLPTQVDPRGNSNNSVSGMPPIL